MTTILSDHPCHYVSLHSWPIAQMVTHPSINQAHFYSSLVYNTQADMIYKTHKYILENKNLEKQIP